MTALWLSDLELQGFILPRLCGVLLRRPSSVWFVLARVVACTREEYLAAAGFVDGGWAYGLAGREAA